LERDVAPELHALGEIAEAAATQTKRRRRRRPVFSWRRHWPIIALIGALIGGWLVYAFLLPPLEIRHKIATSRWKFSRNDPEISFSIKCMQRTCEYWFVFWFFYLGASIGSFINVVACRTPQKKTIVTRGSHCPFCDTPLNMIDNSPVFGWVFLRGRCRTCHLPISPRYLIMEIIVGFIFMAIGGIELIGNGMNIPFRDWSHGAGIVSTVFYPKWDLIGAAIAHCSLFAVAVMLIGSQMDRLRFPIFPLLVIGAIYMASVSLNVVLCPVRWTEPFSAPAARFRQDTLQQWLTSLVGASVGLGVGMVGASLLSRFFSKSFVSWTRPLQNVATTVEGLGSEARSEAPWRLQTVGDGDGVPAVAFEASDSLQADLVGNSQRAWRIHYVMLGVLSGTLLGWQACLTVGCASMIVTVGWLLIRRNRQSESGRRGLFLGPQVLALAIWTSTLFLHHCLWRQVAHWLRIG
jgi:prepilin signal peptidase PulO-like enzyme (type II secretory pathway)